MYNSKDDFFLDLDNYYANQNAIINNEYLNYSLMGLGISLLVCVTILFIKLERNKIIIYDNESKKNEEV